MPDPVSTSKLRADIYRLLDLVIETGEPLEIERRGHRLRVVPEAHDSKLERLHVRHDLIAGDPDDLPTIDWSQA